MKQKQENSERLFKCSYGIGPSVVKHYSINKGLNSPIEVVVDGVVIGQFKGSKTAKRAAMLWVANGCKAD